MKAVGYVRVSTQEQANSGLGLEAQRAAITRWAAERGLELFIYEDAGITGTSMEKRPALAAALAAATSGRVLVAYSLSRFARSTRDMLLIAERLKRQGADLVSLTESVDTTTATGRRGEPSEVRCARAEKSCTESRHEPAKRGEALGMSVPFLKLWEGDPYAVKRTAAVRWLGSRYLLAQPVKRKDQRK